MKKLMIILFVGITSSLYAMESDDQDRTSEKVKQRSERILELIKPCMSLELQSAIRRMVPYGNAWDLVDAGGSGLDCFKNVSEEEFEKEMREGEADFEEALVDLKEQLRELETLDTLSGDDSESNDSLTVSVAVPAETVFAAIEGIVKEHLAPFMILCAKERLMRDQFMKKYPHAAFRRECFERLLRSFLIDSGFSRDLFKEDISEEDFRNEVLKSKFELSRRKAAVEAEMEAMQRILAGNGVARQS